MLFRSYYIDNYDSSDPHGTGIFLEGGFLEVSGGSVHGGSNYGEDMPGGNAVWIQDSNIGIIGGSFVGGDGLVDFSSAGSALVVRGSSRGGIGGGSFVRGSSTEEDVPAIRIGISLHYNIEIENGYVNGKIDGNYYGISGGTFEGYAPDSSYLDAGRILLKHNGEDLWTVVEGTAPLAYDGLVYNGSNQPLIKAGKSEDGTFTYGLGTAAAAPGSFGSELPRGNERGDYTVWYRFDGNEGWYWYRGTEQQNDGFVCEPLKATIGEKTITGLGTGAISNPTSGSANTSGSDRKSVV